MAIARMPDRPGWIQHLFARSSAEHALSSAFLLDLSQDGVRQAVAANPDGEHALRTAAREELTSADPQTVALALLFLSVVGQSNDLEQVEPLGESESDLVRRAAKACVFHLTQQSRNDRRTDATSVHINKFKT